MEDRDISKEIFELLATVSKGVRKFGVRTILRLYEDIHNNGVNSYSQELCKCIVQIVIESYHIRKDKLFDIKRGKWTIESEARKMCYVLFKEYASLNERQIGDYFKRDNRVVYRAIEEFSSRNLKIKEHREFFEKYKGICKDLEKPLSDLKKKYKLIN